MTMTTIVRSVSDLLTQVPQLLGFVPEDSLVIIGLAEVGESGCHRVEVTLRYDLLDPDHPDADLIVAHTAAVLTKAGIDAAAIVGYGAADRVEPMLSRFREDMPITVTEVIRVTGRRFWSYPGDSAGQEFSVALPEDVLHTREELSRSLAPIEGAKADAIRRAYAAFTEDPPRFAAGVDVVEEAIETYRAGRWLTDPHAIACTLYQVQDMKTRDMAWANMLPESKAAHTRLWSDLVRYAVPGLPVAAPASLLAFVAWQDGEGALANVALDRALADDPRYSMAQLLRQVIAAGAPPSLARLPMSPAEVAASYDGPDSGEVT